MTWWDDAQEIFLLYFTFFVKEFWSWRCFDSLLLRDDFEMKRFRWFPNKGKRKKFKFNEIYVKCIRAYNRLSFIWGLFHYFIFKIEKILFYLRIDLNLNSSQKHSTISGISFDFILFLDKLTKHSIFKFKFLLFIPLSLFHPSTCPTFWKIINNLSNRIKITGSKQESCVKVTRRERKKTQMITHYNILNTCCCCWRQLSNI
jgi:hypothetical protein